MTRWVTGSAHGSARRLKTLPTRARDRMPAARIGESGSPRLPKTVPGSQPGRYHPPMKLRLLAGLASVVVVTGACTAGVEVAAPTPTISATASSKPATASPPELVTGAPGHEVRAESTNLETWALLWEPSPWKPGQEVKIVWRSTGTGDFRVVAVGPRSQEVPPIAGPTQHFGSTWDRPGDEWGTFFQLEEPGEWLLRVQRGSATASLPITVVAS